MIKVISFDIGGTILYSKSINDYNLKKLTELLNKPYEQVRNAYKIVFQKDKGNLNELVKKFCDNLNIEINDNIIKFFTEKFKEENNISILDENIITIINELKKRKYKIILFSNSCCLIKNNFDDNFMQNIDNTFYSYNIGYTKDEEESFKIVEQTMECLPEEILHIGDTLKSDYLNPKKYGWNALYYGKTEEKDIESIDNLNNIIEKLSGESYEEGIYRGKRKIRESN